MTVKTLKEMLEEVDENLTVYIMQDSALGGFAFAPACEEESGYTEFGPPDDETGEFGQAKDGFCLLPHGATPNEDDEEGDELIPQLN